MRKEVKNDIWQELKSYIESLTLTTPEGMATCNLILDEIDWLERKGGITSDIRDKKAIEKILKKKKRNETENAGGTTNLMEVDMRKAEITVLMAILERGK